MEKRYQHTVNGQSVLEDDLNVLGETSALADDRVFAELFRMTPWQGGSVYKGLLSYSGAAMLVGPNGASGSVLVRPFRAFIGSRTAVATDAKKNWRDIRSAIGIGTATLSQTVAIGANASGNPRWDLVYAAVAVDANSTSVSRKVKDPTTKVIAAASLVTTLETTVTLGVVVGTPGASPAFPAVPTDSSGTYYVPLAYVRVPTGFGAASTVNNKDINEIAPILTIARTTGAATLRPADQQNVSGGTAISGAGTSTQNGVLAWTGAANTRPGVYLPPSMSGTEGLLVAIDLGNALSANWSHQNGAIVDGSRDWRNRLWRWNASVGAGSSSSGAFPGASSTPQMGRSGSSMPGYALSAGIPAQAGGLGSSFSFAGAALEIAQVSALGPGSVSAPANGANISTFVMASGSVVSLFVDVATGELKVSITGTPLCSVLFWLEASGPYLNL